jgi:hypothetical protein
MLVVQIKINFSSYIVSHLLFFKYNFCLICAVGLWVLRPLLACCTSPGWEVMVIMKKLAEWRLVGETQVLGENLPQRHFAHHKSHMTYPGFNPGRRGGKPATNRMSYGAASF